MAWAVPPSVAKYSAPRKTTPAYDVEQYTWNECARIPVQTPVPGLSRLTQVDLYLLVLVVTVTNCSFALRLSGVEVNIFWVVHVATAGCRDSSESRSRVKIIVQTRM